MMMKKSFFLSSVLLCSLTITSCAKNSSSHTERDMIEVSSLLDKGDFETALEKLKSLSNQNPENIELILKTSEVELGLSGIDAQFLKDSLQTLKKKIEHKNNLKVSNKFNSVVDYIYDLVKDLPNLNDKQRSSLDKALLNGTVI